ncbi:MAG TPA: hypothetical protein VND92_01545, partial [Vicinamibacterales bacterium]|nr:hypothetical protein [Vicinamibacterales bacterium]
MSRRSSIALAALPALLAVVFAPGLTARQQASQAQAPPAAPPTFRTATQLVQVDVVVRDKKGNFVG